jgi:signal transduction histidine kinase
LKPGGKFRLCLGREIARAHGGTLGMEDSAAGQTVFCLTLPKGAEEVKR